MDLSQKVLKALAERAAPTGNGGGSSRFDRAALAAFKAAKDGDSGAFTKALRAAIRIHAADTRE